MKAQKQIIRAILMAQRSSDEAKNRESGFKLHSENGAAHLGYALKSREIIRAIKMVNSTPPCGINYYIEKRGDQNGFPSVITLFDIRYRGKRYQISFHTPWGQEPWLQERVGQGRTTHWNHKPSGSHDDANELARLIGMNKEAK